MKKSYILMQCGWEYNDETYTSVEGGYPSKVFTDEAKANLECLNKNLSDFKNLFISDDPHHNGRFNTRISDYAFSYEDILNDDLEIDESDRNLFFVNNFNASLEDWWENLGPSNSHFTSIYKSFTNEQWTQLMSFFNLNFWEVVEVESE